MEKVFLDTAEAKKLIGLERAAPLRAAIKAGEVEGEIKGRRYFVEKTAVKKWAKKNGTKQGE